MKLDDFYSLSINTVINLFINEEKSAASFCCQEAALDPDMFCDFYIVKNHKIANNSATTEARE
jgi:hypothetical protein